MESLQIRTGQISLRILDDAGEERGIFKFNPDDIESAKKLVSLETELAQKEAELEELAKNAETPEQRIDALVEMVDYFEGVIDNCFGAGSSAILFGDCKSLSMFYDFLEGIIPYYEKASKERMAKYSVPSKKKKQ